ncbi:MAG: hypothetical protein ACREBE_17035 [bacterium]
MLGMMRSGGYNMWVLAAIGLVMLWTAIQFSRRADPHRLSILRALTVAIVVASIAGFIAGLMKSGSGAGDTAAELAERMPMMVHGFVESCTNLVFGGAFVVITWVLVALGVRRMPQES